MHTIADKRAISLGCGRLIMPCAKPAHHHLLPDDLYTDRALAWDNCDVVPSPGVNVIADLFRYPWPIEDNTYDVALAAHLVEHIPHVVIRHGVVESAAGGWWAWWQELARILKPGGVVYVLVPYGFSRGVLMDPTHTRYLLPETFGYFNPEVGAPFEYPDATRWDLCYSVTVAFVPDVFQASTPDAAIDRAQHEINVVSEFALGLKVVK